METSKYIDLERAISIILPLGQESAKSIYSKPRSYPKAQSMVSTLLIHLGHLPYAKHRSKDFININIKNLILKQLH